MSDLSIAAPLASTPSLNQAEGGQAIRALRGAQSQATTSAKIDKASRDFESILVGEWLNQAEKSFATVPGDDPDQKNDSGHDQFQSIACQSLAQGLSKAGGFGIAAMISKQLKASQAIRQQQAAQAHTENSGSKVGVQK
ncbi:MAG: rod-binding protein [Terriglobales bacterium]